ncbi:PP2C family protein-serine/threonine phosphatase [Dactylosporangium sp. NPDC051485]|uniref:PP2C family protein-serine/threonine phosphatase n=1 Tax=Dactylosporangium sp. NPDC051485 TaxID=3154846 RepID=UPI0034467AEF
MRITARCQSIDPGARIGGDWYLTAVLPCGDVVLVVGDVVGHGLTAAATMMTMRFATAAYVAEDVPPGVVLSRLNTLLCGQGTDLTASAVVARYRPATGELRWARAGHLPLLLATGTRVLVLPNPDGPLLGMAEDAAFEHDSIRLRHGERIIGYTDGMVGRGSIDEGIRQLASRIQASLSAGDEIVNRLDYRTAADDACVLIAQRTG